MPRPIGSKNGERYVTPCRICGEPTRYAARRLEGKISCDNPDCREKSWELRSQNISRALTTSGSKATCRVCGGQTNYHRSKQGLIGCNNPKCVAESKRMKNEAIRQAALKRYINGERKPAGKWHRTAIISPTELLIKDHLVAKGWAHQYKLVPGVKGIYAPRTYHLDFALVEKKLCVEIDGSSHNKKVEKDTKRDRYLADIGWQTIRLTNKEVKADPEGIIAKILAWSEGQSINIDPPQICAWCKKPMVRSKRKTCSADCHHALHNESIRGRPGRRGIKNKEHNISYIPCRICGEPTKYNGTPAHPRWGKKACDKPSCQEASKELTRQNQSKALKGNQKLIEATQAAWDRREGEARLWPKNRT